MKNLKKGLLAGASVLSICMLLAPLTVLAAEEEAALPSMYATF